MGENASSPMYVEVNSLRYPLKLGQIYMFGRQVSHKEARHENFINIDDKDVDEKHCCISDSLDEGTFIFDLLSKFGTFLNGERVLPMKRTIVKHGDVMRLGTTESVRIYHDQMETSHDSSGYGETNKNTSDVICSSPETTSQRESRVRRCNRSQDDTTTFLVPAVPATRSSLSLNGSEKQVKACIKNDSNLSACETEADEESNKMAFEIDLFRENDVDDDIFIPETQEIFPNNQNSLTMKNTNAAKDSDDEDDLNGSLFRICTQEYNENFVDDYNESIHHSQVLPIFKNGAVYLNSSGVNAPPEQQLNQSIHEEENEMSNISWADTSANENPVQNKNNTSACSTPDLFETYGTGAEKHINKNVIIYDDNHLFEDNPSAELEDVEDYMATQVFPSRNNSNRPQQKEKDIFGGKEDEPYLTSSDKENLYPDCQGPVIDLPQTPTFPEQDASDSLAYIKQKPSTTETYPASSNKSSLKIAMDPEDDILTQAHPQTSKSCKLATIPVNNYFNSTLLDDKSMEKNPASFFAEMEKTSKTSTFKMPDIGFSNVKKTSSASSAASNSTVCSESDMDLIMCTPKLIKDHWQFSKHEDLSKNILAARNKNLFGDDTDDGEDVEDDRSSKDKCLVKLVNIHKDSKDFDKLLPHLRKGGTRPKRMSILTDAQKVAKEAYKEYKFNISFGREQDNTQTTSSKSAALSRDERHAARCTGRETEQEKVRKSNDKQEKVNIKRNSRRARHDEAVVPTDTKRLKEEILVTANKINKDEEEAVPRKKYGYPKTKKSPMENVNKNEKSKKGIRNKPDTNEDCRKDKPNKEQILEKKSKVGRKRISLSEKGTKENANGTPQVRLTRLRSTTSDAREESTIVIKSSNTSERNITASDELDLISTQPLKRITRAYSSNKSSCEDLCSYSSSPSVSRSSSANQRFNGSSSRLNVSNKSNVSDNLDNNTTAASTTSKVAGERKRKAETPAPILPQSEGKRLRRTTISVDSEAQSKTTTTVASTCLISMTMVDPVKFKELSLKSNGLWAIAKNPADCSVLVMDKAFRTFKFLLAMARGIPIVTSQWLQKINETKSLKKVSTNEYLFADVAFEKRHKFSLPKSLQMARENDGIFQGYKFMLTSNIQPQPIEMREIIQAAGGSILTQALTSSALENQQIYLVSSEEDRKEWHKYRRTNKKIIIISTEAIMTAVMRQNCTPLSNYVLS